ncbi:hypothetical protein BDK51DRAFT_38210 [Blyttiomyces helicus]|uniref:Uncharacterized protein n=1 Tax=Blyttiomyces helicus TaxID=388810 RepID=A0A4P9W661_9FUNG|nr:hypothetical protein BDK51DRAFT_38210 [Blyttiomyces helicus]|eukprot:RKO86843.1 hypothetical protein BDK51DRAFT_38210 [Blyttiomyces helicus]
MSAITIADMTWTSITRGLTIPIWTETQTRLRPTPDDRVAVNPAVEGLDRSAWNGASHKCTCSRIPLAAINGFDDRPCSTDHLDHFYGRYFAPCLPSSTAAAPAVESFLT